MLTHRTQVTARRGIRTGIAIILLALMLFPDRDQRPGP
jgi:hypothetical protein